METFHENFFTLHPVEKLIIMNCAYTCKIVTQQHDVVEVGKSRCMRV